MILDVEMTGVDRQSRTSTSDDNPYHPFDLRHGQKVRK